MLIGKEMFSWSYFDCILKHPRSSCASKMSWGKKKNGGGKIFSLFNKWQQMEPMVINRNQVRISVQVNDMDTYAHRQILSSTDTQTHIHTHSIWRIQALWIKTKTFIYCLFFYKYSHS